MKRYLLGSFALLIAVGFSAFSLPKVKVLSPVTLHFQASPLSSAAVTTQTNWTNQGAPSGITCNNATQKACSFVIDDSYTDLVSGVRKLKTTVSLQIDGDATNGYYVVGATVSGSDITLDQITQRNQ